METQKKPGLLKTVDRRYQTANKMLHEFDLYIHPYTELVQKVLPGELD